MRPTARLRVGPQHHVGIQQRHQRLEVTAARGSQERVHDGSLAAEIGVGDSGSALDSAAGAAGEHLGRVWGAAQDGGDLVERHREHVVEHERDPLGRR
jgi:hypothetical protein